MLVVAVALAACGETPSPGPPQRSGGVPAVNPAASPDVEVAVELHDDFTITASPARIRNGQVRFTVTNEGANTHGFSVEGQGLEQFVAPGGTLTRDVRLTPATWVLYCPVADHRDLGMQTEIVVE